MRSYIREMTKWYWFGLAWGSAMAWGQEVVVPAGTVLELRLRQTLSSYGSEAGSEVVAETIAPVLEGERVVLPMRTRLKGRIAEVRRVGLGFSRETARLHLVFDEMEAPGRGAVRVVGRVTQVDNARERVDAEGRIRGIRATDTWASVIAGFAIAAASADPMSLAFGLSSSLSVFRLPDSSIVLPAGSELRWRLEEAVRMQGEFAPAYREMLSEAAERAEVGELARGLAFRTATEKEKEPSDITSLLYVGTREAVERAFAAAGWVRSDALDGKSTYGVMRSLIENQGYRAAPMSVLLLDGKTPAYTYAKTLNTFFTRHHLRIYEHAAQYRGQSVWSSTATYDSGIGFSKAGKTFIHLINENIDEERTKVVNDLLWTGCVERVGYVERPWVPRDAKNATGDTLRTDGRMAVVELNDCRNAAQANEALPEAPQIRERQRAYLRPLRAAVLTLRNDLTRGNLVYQGIAGVKLVKEALGGGANAEVGKTIRYAGQEYAVVSGAARVKRAGLPQDPGDRVEKEVKRREPPNYENQLMFSLAGGWNGFGNERFSTLPTTIVVSPEGGAVRRLEFPLENRMEGGWVLTPRVTLNAWRYVSSEFAYTRTTTTFRVSGEAPVTGEVLDDRSRAAIREFTYNALLHARPKGKRVRPYGAVGPAFQLIHLLDSQPTSNSLLRFAARDVALFVSAFDFGRKPPLQGGGMFQVGLNYGAGVMLQMTPRVFWRVDFRETLTRQPDFWRGSADDLAAAVNSPPVTLETQPVTRHGALRVRGLTIGVGVSF